VLNFITFSFPPNFLNKNLLNYFKDLKIIFP